LFEVKPRGEVIGPLAHKYGCTAVKVVRELPAWMALGPNGEAGAAMIERCRTIMAEQAERLDAARRAARDAARDAAQRVARDAVWDAAWDAARDAAGDAAGALLVRDLITAEQFDLLYGPWKSVMES
jgi:hypothetical protein